MVQISIIVTTLNRKFFLKQTIDSILNQTFQDFEVIIVDGFSEYNFFEFIRSFNSNKIKAFQNNRNNNNISINRNYALKHAFGTYLAFCDDDDIWEPRKLEIQMQRMKEIQPICDKVIIHSNTILFGEDKSEQVTSKFNIIEFADFFLGNPITYSTVLVTKNVEIIFDEDPAKRASEDLDLWVRLIISGYKFDLIDEPLVRYRISPGSAFRSDLSISYLRYLYIILQAIIKYKLIISRKLSFIFFAFKLLLKFVVRSIQSK